MLEFLLTHLEKKKCRCKGLLFAGLNDPFLQTGKFFLTIKGKETEDGYIQAEEVEACRNYFSEADEELRAAVENGFSDARVNRINNIPTDVFNASNGLYNGEIKIGQYAYKLHDDIRLQGYVNMVGERVIPAHQRDLPDDDENKIFFRFYVIDNPIPNAFAFPNGMIFIHTGLMDVIENEAQLATVLGHEIAHVTYEHGRDRYETTAIVAMGKGLFDLGKSLINVQVPGLDSDIMHHVTDITSAITPEGIANVIKPQPKRESQADRVGVYYAYMAGYDIRESAKLWENMSELTGSPSFQSKMSGFVENMLASPQLQLSGDPLQALTTTGKEFLINQLLNTIYTSHPKAQNRAHHIGTLLNSYYQGEAFDSYFKGEEAYKASLSGR